VVHVNALGAFDLAPSPEWGKVVHGAPVLTTESRAVPVELPWAVDDPTPIVLLSFSTVPEQRNPEMLQRALDALAPLSVHTVATTGGVVDPQDLDAPANAYLIAFADHDALMQRASLVLGHSGHGTTMRALRQGLPIVGIPAKGSDQALILDLLEQWHVGRALPGDADVAQIRSAAEAVLADRTYHDEAVRRSQAFAGLHGAQLAADSLETLLSPAAEPAARV
jgi:UDP:flavonoid glycosyltransferase YjiC (YdhE family)